MKYTYEKIKNLANLMFIWTYCLSLSLKILVKD